ncbi:MAG: hypothetical protein WDN69_05730 [Aliidongia sp.]
MLLYPRRDPGLDARGHAVTGAGPETIAKLDRFAEIVLRRGRGGDLALLAAEEAPDCPMALAAAATCHLLADTRAGITAALPLLARAAAHAGRATERERLYIAALTAMAEDRPLAASLLFLDLGRQVPADLFAGYVGHLHCLNHGHFEIMLGLARLLVDANPDDGFALGMLSFALDQNGMPGPAEAAGLAALAADDGIAWVHHALAHVYQHQGRIEDGLALLDGHAADWAECGSSMYTHNWWHTMLLRLEAGERDGVLAAYDWHIAAGARQSTSSFVNAVSLLSRLELRGIAAGARWQMLADEAESRIGEHVLPFLDIHYALALALAGRTASVAALCRSAAAHGEAAGPEVQHLWRAVGAPLIQAVADFGLGRADAAERSLRALAAETHRIGGSSVQRALLAEIAAAAAR